MIFFPEIAKIHPKIHTKSQGTLNNQNNFEKEQNWRTPIF